MITSITLQYRLNANYLNKRYMFPKILGQRSTEMLETVLQVSIQDLSTCLEFVEILNKNLSVTNLQEMLNKHFGEGLASVTHQSKTKRYYTVWGLTIHEEDKEIYNIEKAKLFLKKMHLEIGVGFNPDTDFNDYEHKPDSRKEYVPMYKRSAANKLNTLMQDAFFEFELAKEDIYAYCFSLSNNQ